MEIVNTCGELVDNCIISPHKEKVIHIDCGKLSQNRWQQHATYTN